MEEIQTEYVSISDAAKLYGHSRPAFVWLLQTDRIPYTKIGGRRFVKRADVEKLKVNSREREHRNIYIEPVRRVA